VKRYLLPEVMFYDGFRGDFNPIVLQQYPYQATRKYALCKGKSTI
jgi:hypothetical protein